MPEKRTKRITFRMTPTEYEHYVKDARYSGQTLSGYTRLLFFRYMNVRVK